ncbi:FZO1 [Mytilus edulis]|uniref:MFN2 n=1 Tax=Mytilus edulis TaxID=6550 RepID=A0A8S3RX23_MYTED|nr:FZO1 [Mytilus edulis]
MSGSLRTVDTYPGQFGQGDISDTPRSLGNGHNSRPTSPLKFFARAKSKSNDIFKGIAEYVLEAEHFLQETKGEENEEYHVVHGFLGMVNGIIEKLARDHMKVVFFFLMDRNDLFFPKCQKTSNGKSTTINAMLRNKILPSGIGHTTNCFLQVEGTEASEGFLLTDDSEDPKSISSIKQLASALSTMKLKENSLIRIVWPKENPGIDVTPDLDSWIDQFCLDADVFVLVGNAESTLMQTEKNFFHKVSSRLSKPNIFILQNRWDVSVNEEDADEVKEQHYTRNTQFLTDELKVADKQEATNRIFFVSAKEALISRLHEDSQTPTPTGSLQKNFAERLFAFANFERAFEVCISQSAVHTKFQTHSERGKKITADLKDIMERTYNECLQACEDQAHKRQETADELEYLDKQLDLLTEEIKDKIKVMVEEVERNVSFALNDEIKRLSALVDDFARPFHPDNLVLSVYKKELHNHVEEGLGRNVTAALLICITTACGNHSKRNDRSPGSTFKRRRTSTIPRPMSSSGTPMTPRAELQQQDNQVLMSVITTFATITSRSTMGGVIVAGLVLRVTGWKVVAAVGSLYCMLYLYEWLSWTNKAKERRFKSQYVEYAASKLRLIVDLTSSNCSHQVQQELSSTFARLCNTVDQSKHNLKDDILKLDKEIRRLEDTSKTAKSLRNKADWLDKELNTFIEEFLQKNNEIVHRSNEIVHRNNEIVHRSNEIVHRSNKIVHRNNEIVHRILKLFIEIMKLFIEEMKVFI